MDESKLGLLGGPTQPKPSSRRSLCYLILVVALVLLQGGLITLQVGDPFGWRFHRHHGHHHHHNHHHQHKLKAHGNHDGRFARNATMSPSLDQLTIAKQAAVACDVPLCSEMGVDMMKNGGNAMDAALTVALCIGSVNSFSSGIGGGGFMTVRASNGTAAAINFREIAPGLAHKNMFKSDETASQVGGLAVAVPGELAGLFEAHSRFGKVTWQEAFAPVIDLNRRGFKVNLLIEKVLEVVEEEFVDRPEEWGDFLAEDGSRAKRLGETITRHKYARTLEIIAQNGSAAVFYDPQGPIAPNLAAASQNRGGILRAEDFAHYSALVQDPLIAEFMGREVITTQNPTSGPALVLGLNILNEGFAGQQTFGEIETHRLVETMKWMGSARSQLGDIANKHIDHIVSPEWARTLRRKISDNHTHEWQYYNPSYESVSTHGTSHFSVVDGDGMAVAMTTTVNLLFGSQICDPVTGIVLNSEMDDFSIPNRSNYFGLKPSIYNYIAPYKRPLSSTVPTIVVNQKTNAVEMVIGAAGGSHITTAVLEAIVRRLLYGLPMLETIAYPRVHHQLLPDEVNIEYGAPKHVVDSLVSRNHSVAIGDPSTAMNGIYIGLDEIHAVSDYWRKGGSAAGY
ncbi:glutathione hydrolase proenzyme [Trichomonascus vanleenenianus]|uniref:gamma-glutamyltransferase family protein n=1 Tax=Trichomonascus vanleenenianus TaxID=2268995 RepID=UPI003EC9A1D9